MPLCILLDKNNQEQVLLRVCRQDKSGVVTYTSLRDLFVYAALSTALHELEGEKM